MRLINYLVEEAVSLKERLTVCVVRDKRHWESENIAGEKISVGCPDSGLRVNELVGGDWLGSGLHLRRSESALNRGSNYDVLSPSQWQVHSRHNRLLRSRMNLSIRARSARENCRLRSESRMPNKSLKPTLPGGGYVVRLSSTVRWGEQEIIVGAKYSVLF